MDILIKRLRTKIEPYGNYIHTIYGVGYKFEVPDSGEKKIKSKLKVRMVKMNLCIIIPFIVVFNIISLIALSRQLNASAVERLTSRSYTGQVYTMKYFRASTEDDRQGYLKR